MAPKKRPPTEGRGAATQEAVIVITPQASPLATTAQLPYILRFPLVVVLTLSINALTNTIAADVLGPSLAPVSRTLNEGWQAAAVVGWKALELGVAWFMGFDDLDCLAFTYLTHLPHDYFLHTFYLVPWTSLVTLTLTTLLANWLPFRLLRRRNPSHQKIQPSANPSPVSVSSDRTTTVTTTILASALYCIPLFYSLTTWLPVQLATHFDGLRTLNPAHTASIPLLLLTLVPTGYFVRKFLFDPVVHPSALIVPASTIDGVETDAIVFDPETATLYQTLMHNLLWWQAYHPRTRMLLQRTATLMAWTAANSWFLAWVVIEGSEGLGALAWAGVWAVSAGLSGLVLGWVGGAL